MTPRFREEAAHRLMSNPASPRSTWRRVRDRFHRVRLGLVGAAAAAVVTMSAWSPASAATRPGASTDLRILRVNVDDPLSVAMMNENGRASLAARLINEAVAQMPDDGAGVTTAIRVMGAPLAHGRLTEQSHQVIRAALPAGADAAAIYEKSFANVLVRTLDGLRERYPAAKLSVFGLPLDSNGGYSFDHQAVNARYADVIDRMDAFVSGRSFLLTGADAMDDLRIREALPETLNMAGDRPIFVQRNGSWSGLTASTAGMSAGAMTDGEQRIDPAAVASSVSSTGVTVTIRARRDMYSTPKGQLLQVGDRGVLANDLHSENRRLFAELVTPPVNGRIILRWDGSFAYRPNPGFTGIDRFEYKTYDWRRDPVATAWAVVGVTQKTNNNNNNNTGGGSGNETGPYLVPGSGWAGPTPQPNAVGSPGDFGYDAKAIARWDVVPYQTFTGDFNVGVVAFHINGIDRVEFAVNGGPWTPVREMRLNPQTNVHEYWATLRASDFPDGPVEVRAIAWPNVGEPRVLAGAVTGTTESARGEHSMFLNTNANGTLPSAVRYVSPTGSNANNGLTPQTPKLTVANAAWSIHQAQGNLDGATIYLLQGTHSIGSAGWPESQIANSQRWLTIAAAPGLDRADVRVRGAAVDNRLGQVKLLRWNNVSIDAVTGAEVVGSRVQTARIWYDAVAVDGVDRTLPTAFGTFGFTSWNGGKFITDSTIRNVRDAASIFRFVRNVHVEGILSDAFSASSLVINSSVTDINPYGTDAHPDIAQFHGGAFQNIILYGLTSDPHFDYPNGVQGLFFSREASHTDVAVIDSVFSNTPSWSAALLLEGPMSNMFFQRSEFDGSARFGQNVSTHNVVFDQVRWKFTSPGQRAGVHYRGAQ